MCLWGRGWRGIRAVGVRTGWYGVRIPIWWSVRVDVNAVREGALLLSVIVICAGHYTSTVIVSASVVTVVGFLAGEGEVDPYSVAGPQSGVVVWGR